MHITEKNILIAINKLLLDFKTYPDKYLTESDVRCLLINELLKIDKFSYIQNTADESKSIPVHTEVRWYGQSNKLRWRSDIVIINVANLKVKKNNIFKIPSKGFSFEDLKAIIEIKLRRTNGESDREFIKKINKDVDKIKNIKTEIIGNYFCYLLVLDKKTETKPDVPRGFEGLNLIYQHS